MQKAVESSSSSQTEETREREKRWFALQHTQVLEKKSGAAVAVVGGVFSYMPQYSSSSDNSSTHEQYTSFRYTSSTTIITYILDGVHGVLQHAESTAQPSAAQAGVRVTKQLPPDRYINAKGNKTQKPGRRRGGLQQRTQE